MGQSPVNRLYCPLTARKVLKETLGLVSRRLDLLADLKRLEQDYKRERKDLSEAEALYREAVTYGREGTEASAPLVQRAIQKLDEVVKQQARPPVSDDQEK